MEMSIYYVQGIVETCFHLILPIISQARRVLLPFDPGEGMEDEEG